MTKRSTLICAALSAIILAGCWDQRLLKEHSLVLSIGYDLRDDGKIIKTVTYPKNTGGGAQDIAPSRQSNVVTMAGRTVKDAESHMDQILPEKFDRSKAKVIFLGEELASEGVFSTLDSIYRDLRGPLNATVAVFDGTARDALNLQENDSLLVSDHYAQLLDSAETAGLTKKENVQSICPVILSEGKDIVLPYVRLNQGRNDAEVEGLALFYNDKMTGTMNIRETGMFLILSDQTPKETTLSLKVSNDKKKYDKNFVNIAVRKSKRKIKMLADKGHVEAKINVILEVEVDEFASNQLNSEKRAKALSKEIENELNKLAERTIARLQEANSDALGLGEKMKAYHHSTWEKIDWDKTYPEIPIETTFHVDILRHGIIN